MKKEYLKNHYCIDCKKQKISYNSFAYGEKRCLSCANKGKHNPRFGKQPWNYGLHVQCNTGRTHFRKGEPNINKGKKDCFPPLDKSARKKISIFMKKHQLGANNSNWYAYFKYTIDFNL